MLSLQAAVVAFEYNVLKRLDVGRRNAGVNAAVSTASAISEISTIAIANRYQGLIVAWSVYVVAESGMVQLAARAWRTGCCRASEEMK